MLVETVRQEMSNIIEETVSGCSLRAGGGGFPPATQSMAPGYFRR